MRWPWLTTAAPSTSSGSQSGKFTLTRMPLSIPASRILRDHLGAVMLGAVPLGRLRAAGAVGLGERDRRNAEDRALDGARDRARIAHVLRHVLAPIDAGEDEVGLGLAA